MMPALGKVGPRPGCLLGAFSSGRTGWLGRESGCGGGKRGGEKVLPQGLEGARVSTAGAAPLHGLCVLLAPTSYCGCRVGSGAQARSSWCRGSGLDAPGPGGGGEGVRCRPPLPLGPLPGAAGAWTRGVGCLFLSPGAPYKLRPLPARHPAARATGLCHPLPRSNLAEAAASPAGLGRGVAVERGASPLRRVSCSAGGG